MTVTEMDRLPVLAWLEVRGFRAFGTEPRRLDLDAPLSVVHGGNSVGKSSLAEALEFLLTGRSSRRDLLGGAKAEYHESLRNAHLPTGDRDVWVAAGVRGGDGQVHEVRRELVCDFAQGMECASRLIVEGVEQSDLSAFGLAPAEGSDVGAPVLLQHTLRHVLSTQPKDRVAYFKSLLSLTDLDALRERVTQARRRFAAQPSTPAGQAFAALDATPFSNVAQLLRLALPEDDEAATQLVHEALLAAGARALGQRPDDLESLVSGLQAAVDQQREVVFPLAAFTAGEPPGDPTPVDVSDYAAALAEADREAATLAPIFSAVLAVPALSQTSRPVDCPVCATPSALTPERMAALRDELRRGAAVQKAAQDAARELRVSVDVAARARRDAAAAVPAASTWTPEQVQLARQRIAALGLGEALLLAAGTTAQRVVAAASTAQDAAQFLEASLQADLQHVERRADLDDQGREAALRSMAEALAGLRRVRQDSDLTAAALRAGVEPVVSTRTAKAGLAELLLAARHADTLVPELRRAAVRARADTRLANAEKALAAAVATVLDSRFEQMSGSIARWWLTIRPEELVAFAGVQRRAAGTTFVNLMASLRTDSTAEPVERHALGIFSDSQLNALGLSTFLARTELLRTPLVVLDDPIPGSDGDHRLTFVQNTLEGLLAARTQVVLITYDDKLAEWAAAQHVGRDCRTFELTLGDQVAGTEATQTSDVFDQLMLEAGDSLNAPTAKGRRAACNTYRSAAERLAKQVIATGRTTEGVPTTVGDVEKEAKVLGELAPLVKGFALNNTEKGYWGTFAKVLNPGSHDDQVPSTPELKQVRGNLRRLNKDHKAHWPDGLVR